jgi:16S rRNA (cytosine1402-N4)-methyltransferase
MGLELHHNPVMTPEVLHGLYVQPGGRYIDATLGEGGHSKAIIEACNPGGQVLGIDADPEAIQVANKRIDVSSDEFLGININFRDLRTTALRYRFAPVHGILFDLGVSSLQLDKESRGFSFKRADPLDMRFDLDQRMLASDIVNHYPEQELADLIYRFGEDPAARHIAKCIVRNRPIATSLDLGEIIQNNLPKRPRKIHPATLTFQALRIAVNDELNSLENGLEQALSLLGSGGRIVVISYHSLEDRIVKNLFKRESSNCICPPRSFSCQCEHAAIIKQISRKVFKPSKIEINKNPRARSAKMRIAERI